MKLHFGASTMYYEGSKSFDTETLDDTVRVSESCISHLSGNRGGVGEREGGRGLTIEKRSVSYMDTILKIVPDFAPSFTVCQWILLALLSVQTQSDHCSHFGLNHHHALSGLWQ